MTKRFQLCIPCTLLFEIVPTANQEVRGSHQLLWASQKTPTVFPRLTFCIVLGQSWNVVEAEGMYETMQITAFVSQPTVKV